MPTKHESTTPFLDPRSLQTGICLIDGQIVCGLFRTIRQEDEFGVSKLEPERLNGTLVAHRCKSGATILRPKRNNMYVSMRRVRQLERKHRVEFKFLNVSQVDPHAQKLFGKPYFGLTKQEKWGVCASIAQHGVYLAVEADIPAFIATPKRPVASVIPAPQPKTQHVNEAQEFLRALFAVIGFVALLAAPFLAIRGLQLIVGGAASVAICYSLIVTCVVANRRRVAVAVEEGF